MGRIYKNRLETKNLCIFVAFLSCRDNVFDSLLFAADQTLLFRSVSSSDHCLHSLLPAIKIIYYQLRDRVHELVLPEFITIFFIDNPFETTPV